MRALRLRAVNAIALEEVPEPSAGPNDLVVQVLAAGLCGSDRHILAGEYPSAPPVTLGHEVEGVVIRSGPGLSLSVGTRVAIDPNISCLRCRYCHTGLFCHCEQLHAIGVDLDGGLAEMVSVPERQAYVLPDDFPVGFGALCEPLACCLRAMDHAGVKPGYLVAILGGGVIGQLLAQLARLAGAKVLVAARSPRKRGLAEALGATAAVDFELDSFVQKISGPRGFAPGGVDVAFEATGAAEVLPHAAAVVRRAGTVVVVGAAPKSAKVEVSPYDIFERELRIVGSHLNPLTHGRAVKLAASGQLQLAPLVTRTVTLEDAANVLTSWPNYATEIKIQVIPSQ